MAECPSDLEALAAFCGTPEMTSCCTQPYQVVAKYRNMLIRKLMDEACKPGGEILEIDGCRKSRAEWLGALQNLIDWTFTIRGKQGMSEGPCISHVPINQCRYYCKEEVARYRCS